MKIVIINGQGGVGKDYFVSHCGTEKHDIYSVSTIRYVKEVAKHLGWEGGKLLRERKFLSDLKNLLTDFNDMPYKVVGVEIARILMEYEVLETDSSNAIIFVHCREPKEIERFVSDYNAKTLLIRCPAVEGKYGNEADDGVFNYEYDYTIWNDRTSAFDKQAENFIKQLRSEQWESRCEKVEEWRRYV